jgi:hypothetical protein
MVDTMPQAGHFDNLIKGLRLFRGDG